MMRRDDWHWGYTWASNRATEVKALINDNGFKWKMPGEYVYLRFISKRMKKFCYGV